MGHLGGNPCDHVAPALLRPPCLLCHFPVTDLLRSAPFNTPIGREIIEPVAAAGKKEKKKAATAAS